MANWCDYHVGFNSESLVDLVTEESLKEVFDTEEPDWAELDEEWSDKGYGFCIPMNFENENEVILYELGDDIDADDYITTGSDGEVEIQSNHPNLQKILNVLKELNPKYYDKNQKVIKSEEFENMIKTESDFVLTVCELEGPV
jgi:hypothetical protein